MRAPMLSLALLAAAVTHLTAQNDGVTPTFHRPALPLGADTCDAYAYYQYGLSQLKRDPAGAAAAFYWTQRLSPGIALAYYAERIALLMADRDLLRRYVEGDRRTLQSARVQQIDSLQVRALTLDPFFARLLDETLIVTYFTNLVRDELGGRARLESDAEIEDEVRSEIEHADPETRTWLAHAEGFYRQAADGWAQALRRDRNSTDLRVRRAHALFLLGELDSARVELETALVAARRSDAQTMKYVYDSKVLWEYELGRIREAQGADSAARDAYQRTLVEDLSFHPAHVRLAQLALRHGDTATAVTELERAIDINGDDFSARALLGIVHARRHAVAPAAVQLRRAAEIEPWVAQPHLVLADVLLETGDRAGALAEYQRFLSLAARNDRDRERARQQLARLSAAAP